MRRVSGSTPDVHFETILCPTHCLKRLLRFLCQQDKHVSQLSSDNRETGKIQPHWTNLQKVRPLHAVGLVHSVIFQELVKVIHLPWLAEISSVLIEHEDHVSLLTILPVAEVSLHLC